MGIKWKMERMPESLSEALDDMKEDEDEGRWKPVARTLFEKDPELEKEIKKKDPEVAKELEDEKLFEGEDSDSTFSILD